jgi:hypothetical protein
LNKNNIKKSLENKQSFQKILNNNDINEYLIFSLHAIEFKFIEQSNLLLKNSIKFKKNNKFKKEYNFLFFKKILSECINKNFYDFIKEIIQFQHFKLSTEDILEILLTSSEKPSDQLLKVLFDCTEFDDKHYIILISYLISQTYFDNTADILGSLYTINNKYKIKSEVIFEYLYTNNLLKDISFVSSFHDSLIFDFLSFIEHFDSNNYIIKNLDKYKKYINNEEYILKYENLLEKIIKQEKFNYF